MLKFLGELHANATMKCVFTLKTYIIPRFNASENVQRVSGGCKFGHWFYMTRSQDNLASALAGEQMALGKREGEKWGQADYRTHPPTPDKPDCTTQHVRQPVRSSSDGASGQEAASRPVFLGKQMWNNQPSAFCHHSFLCSRREVPCVGGKELWVF